MRKLRITMRMVTHDLVGYENAWRTLQRIVTGSGGNAWRFRNEQDAASWIEFVEWKQGTDPTSTGEGADAMTALDALGTGRSNVWIEAEVTR